MIDALVCEIVLLTLFGELLSGDVALSCGCNNEETLNIPDDNRR